MAATSIYWLTLPMLRLLSSKAQECKDFKTHLNPVMFYSSESSHWVRSDWYPCARVSVIFSGIFASFYLILFQLATSSMRVNVYWMTLVASSCFLLSEFNCLFFKSSLMKQNSVLWTIFQLPWVRRILTLTVDALRRNKGQWRRYSTPYYTGPGSYPYRSHCKYTPTPQNRAQFSTPYFMGPGSFLYRYHCKYTPTPQNRVQFSTPYYTGPGSYPYRSHCKYTPTPQNRVQFSTPYFMGPGSYLYRSHCKYIPTPQNRVQFSTPSYTGLVHTHTDPIVSIPQHPKTGYSSQHPPIRDWFIPIQIPL